MAGNLYVGRLKNEIPSPPTKGPEMKTVTLHGIPYSLSETNDVYMYGTSVKLGKISDDKKAVIFGDDWATRAQTHMAEYRNGLKQKTAQSMETAKKQFQGIQ
jgi:hypothetical protein